MVNKINFTKSAIDRLSNSSDKDIVFYDSAQPFHRLIISPLGTKTFQVYKKRGRTSDKRKVGRYPDISPDEARVIARNIVSILDRNIPKDEKTPTFADIAQKYLTYHGDKARRKPETAKKNISTVACLYRACEPFHCIPLPEIDEQYLRYLHHEYSFTRGSKFTANNMMRFVAACYAYNGIDPNPAKNIKLNAERKRTIYMTPHDMSQFVDAAKNDSSENYRDAFLLSLFTAARIGSVMAMEWKDIQLNDGIWATVTKSSANTDDVIPIALPDKALAVLRGRLALCSGQGRVFPSNTISGHISQPQRAFARIIKRAGLDPKLTPHSLRRSMAMMLGNNSGTDSEILLLLGNRSRDTVGIYAQAGVSELKVQMDGLINASLGAL